MDQTNPLAELTHKRRARSVGRSHARRAASSARRISRTMAACQSKRQAQTSVSSTVWRRLHHQYGFRDTVPQGRPRPRRLTSAFSADEADCIIAQANAAVDKGHFRPTPCWRVHEATSPSFRPSSSVHDVAAPAGKRRRVADSVRARRRPPRTHGLCNMQRQAVPLLKAESPSSDRDGRQGGQGFRRAVVARAAEL
jgi:hypothetical protein